MGANRTSCMRPATMENNPRHKCQSLRYLLLVKPSLKRRENIKKSSKQKNKTHNYSGWLFSVFGSMTPHINNYTSDCFWPSSINKKSFFTEKCLQTRYRLTVCNETCYYCSIDICAQMKPLKLGSRSLQLDTTIIISCVHLRTQFEHNLRFIGIHLWIPVWTTCRFSTTASLNDFWKLVLGQALLRITSI